MAQYEVHTPDGHVLQLTGPDGASQEDVIAVAKAHLAEAYPDSHYADPVMGGTLPAKPTASSDVLTGQKAPETAGQSLARGTEMSLGGVAKGLSYIPDAATNALGAVMAEGAYGGSRLLGGAADVLGGQGAGDTIRSGGDYLYKNLMNPVTIGGSIDKVTGGPQTGADYVNDIGGSLLSGPKAIGQNALAKIFTPDLPKAVNVLAQTEGQKVAQAAQRQNVDVLPADVGGATTRKMTAGVVQTPLGAGPIINKAKQAVGSFLARRNELAGEVGSATDNVGAGEAAQKGAQDFISRTEARGGKLYDAIPIAGTREAILSNSKTALNELTAGLESNPELSKSIADGRLARWQAAINGTTNEVPTGILDADGNPITKTVQNGGRLSWQDLKAFRSYVGELIGRPTLQDSTAKGDLQRLYGALSSDMEGTAKAVGPDAYKAFSRANDFWRARQARIDNVMTAVLGKDLNKNPEGAFGAIQRWASNGSSDIGKLTGLFRSLPKDEADTVRATVIQGLGTARKGAQNATGDAFSPAEFLTNWNNLSPRAKAVLFQGGHRAALDDLATIAGGMKEAAKYANHSNTAGASAVGNLINAGAASGVILGGPKTAVLSALSLGGQYTAGKILSSEALVRQLTRISAAPSKQAALAAVKGLTAVASREPQIATEAGALQQHLMKALNDNVRSVAASGDQQQNDTQQDQPPTR